MKNLITKLLLLSAAISLTFAPVALAHDGEDHGHSSKDRGSVRNNTKSERESSSKALDAFKARRNGNDSDKLSLLITFGDRAISQRQKALEQMEKRLSTGRCSKIDASAKTTITNFISGMKGTLVTQKAAIDASTTLDDAKAKIAAVYDNRVFAHFIPALNGICSAQRIIDLVNGKLTTAVTEMKAAGKDTTTIESQMATAKTAAVVAQDLYKKVATNPKASDASSNLSAAKAKLKEAKRALELVKDLLETERDSTKTSQ